jgi:hypothetical protein
MITAYRTPFFVPSWLGPKPAYRLRLFLWHNGGFAESFDIFVGKQMSDTDRLREIANSSIGKSGDPDEISKAAQLLKLAAEIDQCRADTQKSHLDEKKALQDLRESERRLRADDTKTYISLLAPFFTTLVLAGTLVLQSYQFISSERDKQIETQRQAAVAEDVRWADAVKLLQQSDKFTPAALLLKSFVKSDRYGSQAYRIAVSVLIKTDDPETFANLFASIFEPVNPDNEEQVFDINRSLTSHMAPLLAKHWDSKKNKSDIKSGEYGCDQRGRFRSQRDHSVRRFEHVCHRGVASLENQRWFTSILG